MKRFLGILFLLAVGFLLGFDFREVQGEIKAKREAKNGNIAFQLSRF